MEIAANDFETTWVLRCCIIFTNTKINA